MLIYTLKIDLEQEYSVEKVLSFKNSQEQYHTGRTFRYGDVASFVEETEFLAKEYSTEFRQFERFLTDFSFNNEMERLRSIITQEA